MRFPTYRKLIERYVEKWRPVMGLSDWDLEVKFDERQHQATNESSPEYESTTLHFNLKRIRRELGRDPDEIQKLVLHELGHALTWDTGKNNELLTTQIERAVWRAYQLGRSEAV